jgi:paired small multidrug resistance pump
MPWVALIIAGLFEVIGAIGIKRVAEKDNFINNAILIGGFVVSFGLLASALEHISLSAAYAVWTGIGTLGTTIVGILFFRESKSLLRILCILGIIFAVIGLRVVD